MYSKVRDTGGNGTSNKSGTQVTMSRYFLPSKPTKRFKSPDAEKIDEKNEERASKRCKLYKEDGIKHSIDRVKSFTASSEKTNVDVSQETQCDHKKSEDTKNERSLVGKYDLEPLTILKEKLPEQKESMTLVQQCKTSTNDKVSYTPLEKQFLEIKQNHKDTLLFVECGYKFRFFGDDAEIAAKELNIFAHPVNNFMSASIPTHRLQVHLQRLVSKGYKVGVVRQTETAALKAAGTNKNAPFKRHLDEIYTRATLFPNDLSDEPNAEFDEEMQNLTGFGGFILCLSEGKCYSKTQHTVNKSPLERKRLRLQSFEKQEDLPLEQLIDFGIIAVQPSTGVVMYDQITDTCTRVAIETAIEVINPSEIVTFSSIQQRTLNLLAAIKARSRSTVRIEQRNENLDAPCHQVLRNFYKETYEGTQSEAVTPKEMEIDGIKDCALHETVSSLPEMVQRALGLAICHLQQYKLESVFKEFEKFRKFSSSTNYMKINGTTLRNLEIFKNLVNGKEKGTLFWFLNHTCTGFGKRLLKRWMSKPLLNTELIQVRLQKVSEVKKSFSSPYWHSIQKELQQLPDLERGISLLQYHKTSPQEFMKIMTAFERISKELISHVEETEALQSLELKAIFNEVPKEVFPVVRGSLDMIYPAEARKGDKTKLFKDKSKFPGLVACLQNIEVTLMELNSHKTGFRKVLQNHSLDYVTVSGNEFLVEVKNNNIQIVPDDWIKVMSTKQVSRFRPPAVDQSYKRLCQLRELLSMESQKAWIEFLRSCAENCDILRRAVQSIAELDCLLSLAKVANFAGFSRPDIDGSCRQIKITNGFHPIINACLGEQQQFVPNDTNLREDYLRCMVIAGPNMGGKSSYIKQVALICLLAQMGSYVPAKSATLCPLDAIYTRMGASDNIGRGRSTFMLELEEASEILKNATSKSLVILDELGRGTATHDGTAIAFSTLEYIITKIHCFTLFVTHYPMLGDFEHQYPGIAANFHMGYIYIDEEPDSSTAKNDKADCHSLQQDKNPPSFVQEITFLYKLEQGLAARSYGLNVAKLANLPTDILTCAAKKSKEIEQETIRRRCFRRILEERNSDIDAVKKLLSES